MLHCRDVSVHYGELAAVSGATLALDTGRVGAIIGPSGCGKSTLLRAIAGLEVPTTGTIEWAGGDLAGVPAHRRGFGLMFQDYALFPHLDVARNIGFSLDVAGWSRERTAGRVDELLGLVGLPGYGARAVGELSGGEQQRVALARTLAPEPELVMLDEPLGALDRALRDELLPEMRRIFAALGTTVLYVTHDHDEAFAVADDVFVMREGAVVGSGTPAALWRRPPDLDVARFFGFEPVVAAVADSGRLDLGVGVVPTDATDGLYQAAVAPDAPALDPAGTIRGVVRDVRYTTAGYLVQVEVAGNLLTVPSAGAPEIGEEARLRLDPARILLYPEG